MEAIDIFRNKLKEIADLAFSNGAIFLEKTKNNDEKRTVEELYKGFQIACNDGFKKAQSLLIEEISKYQNLLRKENENLKKYKISREKELQIKSNLDIKTIEQRLNSLMHIGDGIAWHLLKGEIHIMRRYYLQDKTTKFLDSSNIKHAIISADKINENPLDFALITDITNSIQIGDLLVSENGKIIEIELKEGKVNDKLVKIIEEIETDTSKTIEKISSEENFDKNTLNQARRMIRQRKRINQTRNVIKNDRGIDNVSGEKIILKTPKVTVEKYFTELVNGYKELEIKTSSYQIIDTCLHIGMYRDHSIPLASFAINHILIDKTENFMIIDWLSITSNLSEPIFFKPFPPDFIFDILTGKIKIMIGLDFDALIGVFNDNGIKAEWLTHKETMKIRQETKINGLIIINDKAIKLTSQEGIEMLLFGGLISKILYDSIYPSNIAKSIQPINEEDAKYIDED